MKFGFKVVGNALLLALMACSAAKQQPQKTKTSKEIAAPASNLETVETRKEMKAQEEQKMSIYEWRDFYFAGVTKKPVSEIYLQQGPMLGLLSMIGVSSGIANGTAIEPKFILNKKGATPWYAMYASVYANDPNKLSKISSGDGLIYLPNNLHTSFQGHVNWPGEMIGKYALELGEYRVFVIPFLMPRANSNYKTMPQSMISPDNTMEIFGVYEFNTEDPEAFLRDIQELVDFIKSERPDAISRQ